MADQASAPRAFGDEVPRLGLYVLARGDGNPVEVGQSTDVLRMDTGATQRSAVKRNVLIGVFYQSSQTGVAVPNEFSALPIKTLPGSGRRADRIHRTPDLLPQSVHEQRVPRRFVFE